MGAAECDRGRSRSGYGFVDNWSITTFPTALHTGKLFRRMVETLTHPQFGKQKRYCVNMQVCYDPQKQTKRILLNTASSRNRSARVL